MNSDIAAGFLTGFLMFIKISLRLGEGGLTSLDIFRGIINGIIYAAALYFSLGPLCDLLGKSYIRGWNGGGGKAIRFYRDDEPVKYTLYALFHFTISAFFVFLIVIY